MWRPEGFDPVLLAYERRARKMCTRMTDRQSHRVRTGIPYAAFPPAIPQDHMRNVKATFRLPEEEPGYPPANFESVWAIEIDTGDCVIDNIPFFTRQATLGDVVRVAWVEEEAFYEATVTPSQNSLVRVVMLNGSDTSPVRSDLKRLGCSTEQSHLPSLFSVNVPHDVSIRGVRAVLDDGFRNGSLDYEEPILRHEE